MSARPSGMIKCMAILSGISGGFFWASLGFQPFDVTKLVIGTVWGILLPFFLLFEAEPRPISKLPILVCGVLMIALLLLDSEQGLALSIARAAATITFIASAWMISHLRLAIRKNAE